MTDESPTDRATADEPPVAPSAGGTDAEWCGRLSQVIRENLVWLQGTSLYGEFADVLQRYDEYARSQGFDQPPDERMQSE